MAIADKLNSNLYICIYSKIKLKLNKPICFSILKPQELTLERDRIVEISIFKVFPNGNKKVKLG
jgi:hypothetical protein